MKTKPKTKPATAKKLSPALSAIQTRLRKGDIGMIAAKSGYDPSHVSRVLRGIRQNDEIVRTAQTMVGRRKAMA